VITNSLKPWLKATLVYRVHWLRSKALKERWEEECELVASELQWTMNFFDYKVQCWQQFIVQQEESNGATCYAAWQQSIYMKLWEQCKLVADGLDVNYRESRKL
jgi:hypothetical protein